jgi:cytochrome b subunit of formate dehydrogenase
VTRRTLVVLVFLLGSITPAPGATDCLTCHGTDAEEPALRVNADVWKRTVHGEGGVDCGSCHAGHDDFPHERSDPMTACADCHEGAVTALAASVHRRVDGTGPLRPGCASCHGPMHALRRSDDAGSPIHPTRVAMTCGACHADPARGGQLGITRVQPLAAYASSAHARSVETGGHAATCASCHGSHDIRAAGDPDSRVAHRNVPRTCAQCHDEVARTFASSVHGRAAARGVREAPVCTDCHGEHRVLGPADRGSPVSTSNLPKMTCGRCHGDLRVTEKFGMKATQVTAFEESFHGLAIKAGNPSVANCASCHGVHDILPSRDPRSHVHPDNLPATCGACHPGAGTTFAIGTVHVLLSGAREDAHPVVYWARVLYLWLISIAIGGMATHNLLDLRRKAVTPLERPIIPPAARRVRMARWFRVVHAMLLVSFVLLVWSGFALTYQDTWWAQPLVGWSEGRDMRGGVHRLAAVLLLSAFAAHAVHLVVDRHARACIRAMVPRRADLAELRERIRWYFGRRADMPRAPALGYVEKIEYLALAWGTAIMALSGFVLWFETWSLEHFPKWLLDLATVVHFYEAVLATLAILVWHFYFVIFDPLVYPMDTAWITGREAPGRTLERTDARGPREAGP